MEWYLKRLGQEEQYSTFEGIRVKGVRPHSKGKEEEMGLKIEGNYYGRIL
jgi:hypothetical protein